MSAFVEPAATPSQSSLVPSSDVHTSVSASNPHSAHQASGNKGGSSLSLIGSANAARVRLTKDFRSLVRSSSTSATSRYDRRYGRHQRATSVQAEVGTTDARGRNISPRAPLSPRPTVTYASNTMDKPREDSRSGRGFGARLVNFLSRSRSRSRSKKRRSQSMDDIVVPVSEMPTKYQGGSLGRHNPLNALTNSTNTSNSTSEASGSKPLTRSPSRPLSGATTVTDTTVKAKLSKSPRAQQKSPETLPHPIHVQAEMVGTHVEDASGKPKRTNIFSVSISSPRKHSSRDSSISARAASPNPADQPRSLWTTRFRSGSGSSAGGQSTRSNVGGERSTSRETPPPPLPPKPSPSNKPARPHVSAPVSRPVREDTITTLNSPPPPYQYQYEYETHEADEVSLAGRCSPLCGLTSPRLTPVSEKGKEKERIREKDGAKEKGKEREHVRVQERDRERTRVRSPQERPKDVIEVRRGKEREITQPHRVGSPIVREKERGSRIAAVQAVVVPMEKVASGQSGHSKKSKESVANVVKVKRTKHGSFDFERPVSGTNGAMNVRAALRGLGLGAHSSNEGTNPPERRASTRERPARSQPPSHSQSNSQPNSLGRSEKRPTVDITPTSSARHARDGSNGNANHNHNHNPRAHNDHSGHESSTPNSQSGNSSSLGRTGGARMLRGAHGAFKFEPAVPTIPGSPATEERVPYLSRKLNRSPSPTKPVNDNPASKGRSIDLGLSLSWAPQRVKEEAVLSYNQIPGGPNATTSRVRTRWRGTTADEQGRFDAPTSRSASNVAEAFREALGDAAYGTFKTYVHRFDANAIPLEGPYGLIAAASRLLDNAGTLDERGKRTLLDRFVRFVQENQ
ncbi:hypothetical protein BDW22DRAFT_1351093 [Trametopsis cervina]|nr:hypothetical protein BDW22DRAFT_1351093 [Trametopsis cervina]